MKTRGAIKQIMDNANANDNVASVYRDFFNRLIAHAAGCAVTLFEDLRNQADAYVAYIEGECKDNEQMKSTKTAALENFMIFLDRCESEMREKVPDNDSVNSDDHLRVTNHDDFSGEAEQMEGETAWDAIVRYYGMTEAWQGAFRAWCEVHKIDDDLMDNLGILIGMYMGLYMWCSNSGIDPEFENLDGLRESWLVGISLRSGEFRRATWEENQGGNNA